MKKKRRLSNIISDVKPVDVIIIVALFLMLVALTIGVNVGTQNYKENQVLLIQDSMNIFADNQKVQFQQFINNKVEVLEGLIQFPDICEMDFEKQEKFIKGRSEKLGFHHIFVMQENGYGYYIDEALWRYQKNEPYFKYVMDNDIYVSEPHYGLYETIMTISVSIYDESQKKVGALCGAFELKDIEEMFAQNQIFLQGKLLLINRQGNYIVADDMKKVYNQVIIYEEAESDISLIETAFAEKSDQEGIIVQDGIRYLANVAYLPNYDWVIVQCVEEEKIYEGLTYIDIWRIFSIVTICSIVICVVRITLYWYQSMKEINTDALTKCRSRIAMRKLIERLNQVYKHDITLIYFDLNKFKYVNDTYGHDEGDRILCIFSNVLSEVFCRRGQVGRLGGDEFLVVGIDLLEEETLTLCQAVEIQLQEKSKELDIDYLISTSYGYATREKGSKIELDMIKTRADENMYKYKEAHHKKEKNT